MPIKRAEHTKDFTMILNVVLNDERLTYGARGLMAHVLTHYDNWTFSGEDYFVTEKDKKTKVRGYIKELIDNKYLKRTRQTDSKGRLGNSIYTFYECPTLDNPILEKPILENQKQDKHKKNSDIEPILENPILDIPNLEKPILENHILNNTNINNINNNIYSASDYEDIWKVYPNKKGKKKSIDYITKILKDHSKEELIQCIERYIKDVENQRANGFKTLAYKNGSTFFNGGYIDYLDCNYNELETKSQKNNIKDINNKLEEWG